jgi:hypothetical protein
MDFKIPVDKIDQKQLCRAMNFFAKHPTHPIVAATVALLFRLEGDLTLNETNYKLLSRVMDEIRAVAS